MEYGNDHPPSYVSAYNYGELIHWERGRETLAAWQQDPFDEAHTRRAFLEAATGLAYVYIGFSEVVRTATRAYAYVRRRTRSCPTGLIQLNTSKVRRCASTHA
jgi:hypothetical protein